MTFKESRNPEADNRRTLADALQRSCLELFADYGLTAHPLGDATSDCPESALIAAIDFSGARIRGTVALRAARELIVETSPVRREMAIAYSQLADWTCELTNQLVGRLKNKLRGYSVPLTVNVPRLLASAHVDELKNGTRHRFECRYGSFIGYLDVLIEPGFVLANQQDAGDLPKEGDLLLF